MKVIISLVVLSFSFSVFADQCAYISKSQAKKALGMALKGRVIESLCEPCGQTEPEYIDVKSIGIRDVNYDSFWELQVNGEGVDLAYTYIDGQNLSKLSDCPSQGVSPNLNKY